MNDELTCDLRFIVIRFQNVHIKIFLNGSGIIKLVMLQSYFPRLTHIQKKLFQFGCNS
jgi:hypothetical protein